MMTRALMIVPVGLLMVAMAAAEARWADPRGFFEQEKVTETHLRPGLRWISASGIHEGRPVESQMLVVDLNEKGLNLKSLTGGLVLNRKSGQFVRRSTVSRMLADDTVLGAINVAFFDIGSTQASQGLVMRDGRLLREPQPGRPALLVTRDRRLVLAEPRWEAQVEVGGQRRPLAGMNRPQLVADEVVAYQNPWAWSPGSSAGFSSHQKVREFVIGPLSFQASTAVGMAARLAGPVIEIRDDGQAVEIAADQLVLTAGESAVPFFRRTKVGDEVSVSWSLTGLPDGLEFHDIREAVAAQPMLVRDGRVLPGGGGFWETRHPRSAVGIHADGRQAVLVVVDGRSERSAGMSLGNLGKYLAHLGSREALNFDGGGSSALAARETDGIRVLNLPSDGRERPVPTALGVIEETE